MSYQIKIKKILEPQLLVFQNVVCILMIIVGTELTLLQNIILECNTIVYQCYKTNELFLLIDNITHKESRLTTT